MRSHETRVRVPRARRLTLDMDRATADNGVGALADVGFGSGAEQGHKEGQDNEQLGQHLRREKLWGGGWGVVGEEERERNRGQAACPCIAEAAQKELRSQTQQRTKNRLQTSFTTTKRAAQAHAMRQLGKLGAGEISAHKLACQCGGWRKKSAAQKLDPVVSKS